MNKNLDFIFSRRSVRRFLNEPATDRLVQDLLEAAMAAPSACCKDPWHFIVLQEKTTLAAVAAGLPNGRMLGEAAAGIVVCGSLDDAHDHQLSFMLQDCSAAIENLLLAAQALGWGACWLGVHPREERMRHVREVLMVPPAITPISVIAIGRPAEQPPRRTRYSDVRVHREAW